MTAQRLLGATALAATLAAAPAAAQEGETPPSGAGSSSQSEDLSKLMGMSLEELLDTSVTTASKSDEKESSAPGVMAVVTKDELRRFGGTSLVDILERVPSLISSSNSFNDRRTIAARGDQIRLDSGHVLILINGRPTRESLQGGVSSEVLEAFPIDVIERIEVIRGPGSVLYGSNAFSAVINIITEEPKPGVRATVRALGGTPASYGVGAKSTAEVGGLGVVVAASLLERADWNTTYRFSAPGTADVTDTRVAIPDVRQGAYLGLDYEGLRFMSTFNQWQHAYFFRGTTGENTWRRAFGDLGYRLQVSESLNWDMEFHGTYTYAGMSASAEPGVEGQSHDLVGEWTNFMRLGERLRLVAGGAYNHVRGKETYLESARRLTVSDAQRDSAGFYAQVDHQTLDSLKLIAGVQLNVTENISPKLVPRVGVIYNPIEPITVKALYGQAFRAPSINEISLRHPDLWGQPDLRPETVHTLDAGVSYSGEQVTLGLNYFYTRQDDIIMIDNTPSTRIAAPSYYNNLGQITIQGVEFESKYYATSELYFTGSVLYFQSEDAEGEVNVTPIPSLGLKLGASYLSDNGFGVSLFDVYQGPWDRSYTARLNPDPEAYHLLGARLSFDLATLMGRGVLGSLVAFAEADNLLDQQVWLPDWGGVVAESIPVHPGRTLYFGLSGSLEHTPD